MTETTPASPVPASPPSAGPRPVAASPPPAGPRPTPANSGSGSRFAEADAAIACLAAAYHPAEVRRSTDKGLPVRHQAAFSSNLSVDEALLVGEAGFELRGLVSGASVFHVGLVGRRWAVNAEVKELSAAMYQARELAMGRLVDAGRQVGGDGVAGVRLRVERFEGQAHLAQFVALGTAIADTAAARGRAQDPFFTSDLSGQDLYLLQRAGYRPLGLVMGTCVYHVGRQGFSKWAGSQTQSAEMVTYTEALYESRELAMARLQEEAARHGAAGVVGVQVSELSHVWGSHVIEFFAMGTAVRSEVDHQRSHPKMVVTLQDAHVLTDPSAITGQPGGEG